MQVRVLPDPFEAFFYDKRQKSSFTQRFIRAIESRDRAEGFGSGVAAGGRNSRI